MQRMLGPGTVRVKDQLLSQLSIFGCDRAPGSCVPRRHWVQKHSYFAMASHASLFGASKDIAAASPSTAFADTMGQRVRLQWRARCSR